MSQAHTPIISTEDVVLGENTQEEWFSVSPTGLDDGKKPIDSKVDDNDKPVCIFSINEEGTEFTFHDDVLEKIIAQCEAINPNKISIVSVVGDFRTGKSFLLDFFLRYLNWSKDTNKSVPTAEPKLNSMPEWLLHGGSHLSEGNAESDEQKSGFIWRGGKDRTTTGIWMYGRPFARTCPDTKETVPVVLMDTQGMFDFHTSKELTAAIFGLSTLMSSYQVYNVAKQIQEDKMQQLHYFLEFSRVALKEFEKSAVRGALRRQLSTGVAEAQDGKKEEDPLRQEIRPFQVLEYLVRDWQNFDDEDDLASCVAEMEGVLKDAFAQNVEEEHNTREQITAAFEQIKIFLLPHPGTKMTKKKYDGDLSVLEPTFLGLLDTYIRRVFSERVVTKRMYGKELKPREWFRHISAFAAIFKDGKLPKALTLVEAISVTTNLCAKDDAIALYRNHMKETTKGSKFQTIDEMKELHRVAAKVALEYFNGVANFGDVEHISATRKKLVGDIQEEYDGFIKANDHKLRNNLEKYVIPLLAAVGAFVLDTLTDYTCDAWSDNCVRLSRLLALGYYLVILALLYEFYRVYNVQGSAAAGMGAMALAHAALERAHEWKEEYMPRLPSKAAPKIEDIVDELGGDADEDQLRELLKQNQAKKLK